MCAYICIQDDKQLRLVHPIHNENNKNANIKYMIIYIITWYLEILALIFVVWTLLSKLGKHMCN